MSRRRSKSRKAKPAPDEQPKPQDNSTEQKAPRISRRKVWAFRLAALVVSPLLFFLACELALRLTGYGYDTSFLKPAEYDGKTFLTPNREFTWRYFGRRFARHTFPFAAPDPRPQNVTRIVVFGESAAFGDPQPEFGLARLLQAMLELRHPAARFEVVSTAITGINSHAIRSIAHDCRALDADAWVVYMGNNEVVGPYGAGTVFGQQAPPLPLVRASLALQTTRFGQLLTDLNGWLHPPPESKTEWGGMLMFVDNQVPSDDQRLVRTYDQFEANLTDIVAAGIDAGAKVVVSTVASNLRDCAPFASLHRSGLTKEEEEQWEDLYSKAKAAAVAGRYRDALQFFRRAAAIDDQFAELQYLMGRLLLTLDQEGSAREAFIAARNHDALRFRCDSELNEAAQRVARNFLAERVELWDAVDGLSKASANGVPGREMFYDHVHLTFAGNYLLARGIAERLDPLLPLPQPADEPGGANAAWPTQQDSARRLGWTDWHRQLALENMLGRYRDPPFADQIGHEQEIARRIHEAAELQSEAAMNRLAAVERCRRAADKHPEDPVVQLILAELLGNSGDAGGAIEYAERAIESLPNNSKAWMLLGAALATEEEFSEAVDAIKQAVKIADDDVSALERLAKAQAALDRNEEAVATYRRALELSPRFGPAYLGLGEVLEKLGRDEEAETNYRLAVENPVLRVADLVKMALFCLQRDWNDEAAELFDKAIRLNPADARLYLQAGQAFSAKGDQKTARRFFADAARVASQLGEARFLLGMTYAIEGDPQQASVHFEAAVQLMPESIEARLNYAYSLVQQNRRDEAIAEYEKVLQRDPTNARARKYLQLLKTESKPSESTEPSDE